MALDASNIMLNKIEIKRTVELFDKNTESEHRNCTKERLWQVHSNMSKCYFFMKLNKMNRLVIDKKNVSQYAETWPILYIDSDEEKN